MNKFVPLALAALTCATLVPMPASAQFLGGNINVNQAVLQQRIDAGARSGMLTRSEVQSLRTKLARINFLEARLRRSGRGLSLSERNRLSAELSRLSAQINAQLTDSQNRWNRHRVGGHGRFYR